MKITYEYLKQKLVGYGLKNTPQRLAVFGAILKLHGLPASDKIIEEVHWKHTGMITGSVYHILEIFSVSILLKKIQTNP